MDLELTSEPTLFVEVLLPVPIPGTFTYRVPVAMNDLVQKGVRVLVEFGARKLHTGIIADIHNRPPKNYQAKYLLDLLDDSPTVNELQLKFWNWMAQYYVATPGEVMKAGLPAGLKLSSQSRIQLRPEFDIEEALDLEVLSDKELRLLRSLEQEDSIPYEQAADILEVKNPYYIVKELVRKEAILLFEAVKDKYKPKTKKKLRLNPIFLETEEGLEQLFASLGTKQKAKQEEVLMKFLMMVPVLTNPASNEEGIDKKELLEGGTSQVSASSLTTLIRNGILEEFEFIVSRFEEDEYSATRYQDAEVKLSEAQQAAESQVLGYFEEKDIVLFHGVTGSGKTEVYIELIKKVLDSGSQVLFLLPEIVLTAQMVVRLKKIFGDLLGVYHSKFSDNERVEVWKGVADGRYQVVVGVRSSIFLPFENLGLIVVDEEHEPSYKQYDPAPRYNARDMALVLAQMHKAKVVLGSATPSVESFYHALNGAYGLVQLKKRFGDAQLPEVTLADLKLERKRKTMKEDFSSVLLEQVRNSINEHKQVILFQNRRGYAPYVMCEDCSWIPTCPSCSVSLTYHIHRNQLRCHYCGHSEAVPKSCVQCGSTKIRTMGVGTQKLEEDIKFLIPEARVQRLDQDTTRKKYGYQQIIQDFEQRHIDILVGTQMVSKGLDFDHVNLVGVFDIDRMLNFPDFRAEERTFQMLTQVSGRAGRKKDKGLVVIQTNNVKQTILHKVARADYEAFFRKEIEERKQYHYPPFTRLIKLSVKAEDRDKASAAAGLLARELVKKLGAKRVLGPQEPVINKIRNHYLMDILVKLERQKVNPQKVKEIIREVLGELDGDRQFRKVYVNIDVDPV
ncbi:primosomal protein N' [Limibacter armeniacum]|uniref:replication restart helicase PriA n=1 Tax=Limibacter armeniacum TaxID=466084 RepID=UPI002FE660B5